MTPQADPRTAVPTWRPRLLDQLSAAGALSLAGLFAYGTVELGFGASSARDVLVLGCALAMLTAVLLRRLAYPVRAGLFLGSLFMLETLSVVQFGYSVATILIALMAVLLTGLLMGRHWVVGAWGLSTAILVGAAFAIWSGFIGTPFEPARVDPRDPGVALRVTATYALLSGMLAYGVYRVVHRLASSLDETRRALAEATSARNERARAEVDKRAAEARFRSLVEHAPDSIAIVDRDHRVIFANHEDRGRRAVPDPVGLLAEDLVVPDCADRVRQGIQRVFETGEPASYDIQVAVEGRGPVWYASRAGPIVEDGRIERAIVVSSDISQRRALEEQLLQAQKLEAVGQLTGGVAHDFNNLLTVVLGNLQLVVGGLDDGDPARVFVERARAAAQRGSALTQRLLAFARKQTLQPRLLDLGRLVAGMDDLLGRTLGETIQVEIHSAPGLWRCEVDPAQVENALLNLAINARDAMPQGGRIGIGLANVELSDEVAAPGAYVELSVSDAGTGMEPQILEHAFEPFFTTKGIGQGSGLGLSTVYGFAKQSGGHVAIESELGRGTCVRIYLPRAEARSSSEEGDTGDEPQAEDLRVPGCGERILVVEDDDDVRSLSVELLERAGFKTVEAHDGPGALALLDRVDDVALVFSDVVLPGDMTGPQLGRAVRARRPDLPILFTSGYVASCSSSGLPDTSDVALLSKPFTPEALAERIEEALGKRASV